MTTFTASQDTARRAVELAKRSSVTLPTGLDEADHVAYLFREWAAVIPKVTRKTIDAYWINSPAISLLGACARSLATINPILAEAVYGGPGKLAAVAAPLGYQEDVAQIATLCWFSGTSRFGRAEVDELATLLRSVALQITQYIGDVHRDDAIAHVLRDKRRQEGTHKPRRPEINQWIARQLERDPASKTPGLWSLAPEFITDSIGFDRFKKRVTQARKLRRK